MPLSPSLLDLTLRLTLTMCACAMIGLNRGTHGQAAGFRTTILVGLAACVSMVQLNLLLTVSGKTPESFGVLDLMRLPLGILTGVGFIGGGAILRRGDIVKGVTTAATLWIVTVIGLCFGGSQIGLGATTTLLTLLVLWGLRWIDGRIPRQQRAHLVVIGGDLSAITRLPADLKSLCAAAALVKVERSEPEDELCLSFKITWTRGDQDGRPLTLSLFCWSDIGSCSLNCQMKCLINRTFEERVSLAGANRRSPSIGSTLQGSTTSQQPKLTSISCSIVKRQHPLS